MRAAHRGGAHPRRGDFDARRRSGGWRLRARVAALRAGGGVALGAQVTPRGGASLLGPPLQGWWALSFWTQVEVAAPAALLVSFDFVASGDAAAAARAGPTAYESPLVRITAASLAGSGRQLPPVAGASRRLRALQRRRLHAASAAPWAHIVIPMLQFGAADAIWNRISFQVRAACLYRCDAISVAHSALPHAADGLADGHGAECHQHGAALHGSTAGCRRVRLSKALLAL